MVKVRFITNLKRNRRCDVTIVRIGCNACRLIRLLLDSCIVALRLAAVSDEVCIASRKMLCVDIFRVSIR